MRPGYEYLKESGPDFDAITAHAFRAGPGGAVIELPLTTVFTGLARRGGAGLYRALGKVPKGRGVFARTNLLSRIALTPEQMPIGDALEAIAVGLGEGLRLLNFSFHSPSVAPGHTPYVARRGRSCGLSWLVGPGAGGSRPARRRAGFARRHHRCGRLR